MEGFCRGCLIKYDEPMELLQYTEKNRRLFVYSTGLQVKRNDTFTFQLCKDCFLNMKQACKFKKQCRTSDKQFKNYLALKNAGNPVDFCTFLKNNDETLTFRLPMTSGNSTPATQKCREDDNESTCTSIRNFMTDILQGEEMPDTEARIIKEVIEEEADVLDDSLDSHWMQDDMSIDTDFRLDFSFSPFSTPRSVNNDRCYTPKQTEDPVTFHTINSKKQTKILNDFTNAFKTDENITERNDFGGEGSNIEKSESYNFSMEINAMNTLDSNTNNSDQNLKELCEFGIENIDSIHKTESNQNMKDLCNFGKDEVDGIAHSKSNQSLTKIISNLGVDETDAIGKSENNNLKSNRDIQELFDFSLDDINNVDKAESKVHKNVQSLKELCDLSLDSIVSIDKTSNKIINKNQNLKELYDLSLNSFDDTSKSERNTFKTDRNIKEIFDFGIDEISGMDKSVSNMDLPSLPDVLKRDKIDTPDFDIPKGVIGSIQSSNDVSNGSINIEALLKDRPCTIDKNLEKALKNTDNKEFSLEDLLTSPPAATAASTPTITNILFGEKLDTPDTNIKIDQFIEPSHDVQGDIEIFEEFFQNDTKEFDLEDIIRENERFKPEDWKKLIADNGEVDNKENEFKNVDMDISFGDKDQADNNKVAEITKSEIEGVTYFFDTTPNDKFDIETFYCKLCNFKYGTSRALSVHFSKTHNIKIIKAKNAKREAKLYIADTSLNDKFDIENAFCKLCKKEFKTRKALSLHFSIVHKIRIAKPDRDKKIEICCHCGGIFKNSSNFAKHVKQCQKKDMTEKIFKCDSCQEEFNLQIHLEKHKISHTQLKIPKINNNKKKFICTFCGAIMHKQSNLTIHMRRHTKDYVTKCDVCDKGFYRNRDLDIHMRGHTGETPYACKFCPKLFTRRDVLTRHVLTHLGQKLFECDHCNKKYYKKCDLIKHIKRKSCRKAERSKKRNITDKKKKNLVKSIKTKKEESKEIEEEIKEVEKDITIMYAKESNATIKAQLPFLETERSN